jgi:predicted dehydrogenase
MRALVVGFGRMGRFHAGVLADIGYDVTTVDPDPVAGAQHRRTPYGRHFDVVCMACPIAYLAEQAAGWSAFGGHLLIEKPMAATAAEARELASALAGRRVAVGYVERFNPCVRALREQLAVATEQVVGARVHARFVRTGRRPSPDVRLDLLVHGVDLARWMQLRAVRHEVAAGERHDVRTIDVYVEQDDDDARRTLHADLTAHSRGPRGPGTGGPLYAQWFAFLSGLGGSWATPANAVAVLDEVEATVEVAA